MWQIGVMTILTYILKLIKTYILKYRYKYSIL